MRITLSTSGMDRERDCHAVASLDHSVRFGRERIEVVSAELSAEQGLSLAYDLLYQAIDAGLIGGWNVSFPEHVLQADR